MFFSVFRIAGQPLRRVARRCGVTRPQIGRWLGLYGGRDAQQEALAAERDALIAERDVQTQAWMVERLALIAERDRYEKEAEHWLLRVNADLRVPPPLQSRQVAFMHLMKCGGSSIQVALAAMMEGVPLMSIDQSHYDVMSADELAMFGLLMGHFSYDHVDKFRRPFLVTFLRDPVDRVVSMYEYLRSQPDTSDNAGPVLMAKRLSLAEWVSSPSRHCVPYAQNTQAQALATDWRARRTMPDEQLAELAMAHLQTFGFVGFLETIDADMQRLAELFGFSKSPMLPHEKRSLTRASLSSLDAETRSAIEARNQADMILYREAWARFAGKGRQGDESSIGFRYEVCRPEDGIGQDVLRAENAERKADLAVVRRQAAQDCDKAQQDIRLLRIQESLFHSEFNRLTAEIETLQARLDSTTQDDPDPEAVHSAFIAENRALRETLEKFKGKALTTMAEIYALREEFHEFKKQTPPE